MPICLLRAAIDEQTGQRGLGKEFIQTGNYREYRLCDEAKDFVVATSFDELPADLMDPELKQAICPDASNDKPLKPR